MSLQSIHDRAPPAYTPSAAGTASANRAMPGTAAGDSMQAAIQPSDGSGDPAPAGDGSLVKVMRASLAAAGITQQSSGLSQADYEQKLHAFTHAVFDATHAQKQADRVGVTGSNAGNGIDMASALTQLSSAAAAGTAPDSLQASFNALRHVMTGVTASGGGSLQSVLSGMAATATPDRFAAIGNVVDLQA